VVSKSYDFSKVLSCHATPVGAIEEYCHTSGSSVTTFSTSKTSSNVADVAAPMHMVRPKGLNPQKFLGAIIIKILKKD
jgi:hypothetical protein